MTQQEFFEKTLGALEALGISHMVTGSVGAMLFGEPRLTNDMDVVVDLDPGKVQAFAGLFAALEAQWHEARRPGAPDRRGGASAE